MTVKRAREFARQWMVEEAGSIPGFYGAYTAGSTNWLPEDTELGTASDVDIMVVLADGEQRGTRRKFVYHDVLFEISYLTRDLFQSPERILGDYHLAPSFRTASVLVDPSGYLTRLFAVVCRDYSKRERVVRRCSHARDKVLANVRAVNEHPEFHDRVMACLFAAGVTTHVLLAAGLKNPTVRTRYVAVRELLAERGQAGFHESLLELLGSVRLSVGQVSVHLSAAGEILDAARTAIRSPFPFGPDISESGRTVAIDGGIEMIARGDHREAMFWIGVTYSRCQKVLSVDAPEVPRQSFSGSYERLAGDLGLGSYADIRRRCADIEKSLPRLWEVAESIIAANREIED
jgi:hypothetical protein